MRVFLAFLFVILGSVVGRCQQPPAHYRLLSDMTSAVVPNVSFPTYAMLDGFTYRNDGFGGWFFGYTTNGTPLVANGTNIFRMTNAASQAGNWIRLLIPGAGGTAPFGAVGGDLSGSLPNPTVDKLDGATVPAAGALTTGNVLQVSGSSALTYGPVNLAGGVNYVTGITPTLNGGTGFNTYDTGELLHGNASGTLTRLGIGNYGDDFSISSNSIPLWLNAGEINLISFGAIGNGTSDCTSAVQAAMNFAADNAKVLVVPPGTYVVGDLTLPTNGAWTMRGLVTQYGSEANMAHQSTFKAKAGTTTMFTLSSYVNTKSLKIENLSFNGDSIAATGLRLRGNPEIRNCFVYGCTEQGILGSSLISAVFIQMCSIGNSGHGMVITNGTPQSTKFTMNDCQFNSNGKIGLVISEGSFFSIEDSDFESNTQNGLRLYRPAGITVSHGTFDSLWFEDNGGVAVDDTRYAIISDSATHDLVDGPPAHMQFKNCQIFAATLASQRALLITAGTYFSFDNCQFSSVTDAVAIQFGTWSAYNSWNNKVGGAAISTLGGTANWEEYSTTSTAGPTITGTVTATTAVSTPAVINPSGAIAITPAAGSNLNVTTSGSGDVSFNNGVFYIDSSLSRVGIGTTGPTVALDVRGAGGAGYFSGPLYIAAAGGTDGITFTEEWQIRRENLVTGDLHFENLVNLMMKLSSSGLVTIPGSLALATDGGVNGLTLTGDWAIRRENAATGNLYFENLGILRMMMTSSGVLNIRGLTPSLPMLTDSGTNVVSGQIALSTMVSGDLPFANIAQIATGTLLGRNTAGTGDIEVVTDIATGITIGGAYIYRVGGTDVAPADGGTGRSTLTQDGVLYGNATSAVGMTAQGGANTVLVANSGPPSFSSAITVGTSVTTPSVTVSGLTSGRIVTVSTGGLLADDSDFTVSADTLTATKLAGTVSVRTPVITAATTLTLTTDSGGQTRISGPLTVALDGGNNGITFTADWRIRRENAATGNLYFENGSDLRMSITPTGATSIIRGLRIGSEGDAGDNNLLVDGSTTTATLNVASISIFNGASQFATATANTVAVFDASQILSSSAVTTTTLAFLDATSSIQTQLNARALATTSITAGDGLTGGGDFSANRTINVVGGTGITANANDVAINEAANLTWTGLHEFREEIRLKGSSIAAPLIYGGINGDPADRFVLDAFGAMSFGDGSSAPDTSFYRTSAGTMRLATNLVVDGLSPSSPVLTDANRKLVSGSISLATQVTGNLPVANLNGGSGASSGTFWRGDGTWGAATVVGVESGTYTPTLFNVANLTGSTAFQCQYLAVFNTVTVSGKVSVDPTTTLTLTQLGISLPPGFASAFSAQENCGGTAYASGIAAQGAAIRADATNDRAEMVWIAADVTDQPMYFQFSYVVQ